MKLEEIGFYTLSDERARNASASSDLWRCELILTDRCNLNCVYCRPLREDCKGTISKDDASYTIWNWAKEGLKNIRFSGGEPTLYPDLVETIQMAQGLGIERIAVSTNGTASQELYKELIVAGVNDFSVSLDACCSSTMAQMCGRDAWDIIVNNLKFLAEHVYTTVGVVLTDDNINETCDIVDLAILLGVDDIRLIPAAQDGNKLETISLKATYKRFPILAYRMANMRAGKKVRGLSKDDNKRCPLVLDDMAVAGDKHFPCIIYLREQGEPIGLFTTFSDVRKQREQWYGQHDTHEDPICSRNCLDVCAEYNNKWAQFREVE